MGVAMLEVQRNEVMHCRRLRADVEPDCLRMQTRVCLGDAIVLTEVLGP